MLEVRKVIVGRCRHVGFGEGKETSGCVLTDPCAFCITDTESNNNLVRNIHKSADLF